jgi:hypothetical protein
MKGIESFWARRGPTVLLPDPLRPRSQIWDELFMGKRLAGNRVLGECGSQFQGLGKRLFSGRIVGWQTPLAICIG